MCNDEGKQYENYIKDICCICRKNEVYDVYLFKGQYCNHLCYECLKRGYRMVPKNNNLTLKNDGYVIKSYGFNDYKKNKSKIRQSHNIEIFCNVCFVKFTVFELN